MERFKVTLNDHQHTIGVSDPGVLTIILSAVSREEEMPARHECRLELGGLDSSTGSHLDWATHDLTVGDKIKIEILAGGESDKPAEERKLDPQIEDERKKDYIRKLALEFGWTIIEEA
jgi:hypothetical protein